MKAPEFIDEVLIGQIGRVQNIGKQSGKDCHYLSFSLICSGIEFLGACLDDQPFDQQVRYGRRFKQAICELFPNGYHEYADRLYKSLRCGIVHVALPKNDIGLTQKGERIEYRTQHLELENSGKLVLVSETFYNDFKEACEEVKRRIRNDIIVGTKVQTDIFHLPGEQINGLCTTPSTSAGNLVFTSTTTNES